MKIQDAVARLNRAGDENSKATKKLHLAVSVVAGLIEDSCPLNVSLPRGYMVVKFKSNVGSARFLRTNHVDEYDYNEYVDGLGSYLHGDFNTYIPAQTREVSLKFARDVAEGLLDEISDFLEARKAESLQSVQALEASTKDS